nr:hypothetical protein [Salmonella enterica]
MGLSAPGETEVAVVLKIGGAA